MVQDPQQAIPKLQISSAFTLVFLVLLGSSSKSIATGLSVGASGGRASLGGYASDNSAGVQYLQGLPGFGKKSHLFSENRLHDTLPGQESTSDAQENIRQDANSNGNYRGFLTAMKRHMSMLRLRRALTNGGVKPSLGPNENLARNLRSFDGMGGPMDRHMTMLRLRRQPSMLRLRRQPSMLRLKRGMTQLRLKKNEATDSIPDNQSALDEEQSLPAASQSRSFGYPNYEDYFINNGNGLVYDTINTPHIRW